MNQNGLYLSTKLSFGKYKGSLTFYDIIKQDISYADWVISIWRYEIDPRVTKMFNEYWERRNEEKFGFRNNFKY